MIQASFQCERTCNDCGKNFYIYDVDEDGKGMKILEGDRVLASAGAISMSLERAISATRFSRHGISWYAQMLYYMHQAQQPEEVKHMLSKFEEEAISILKMSPLLEDLDLSKYEDGSKIVETVTSNPNTREHFAYEMLMGAICSKTCIDENNAENAIFAMSRLMNARSMLIFKDTFEKFVWSGYLVGDLKDLLKIWQDNNHNAEEKFWEDIFRSNQLVLSQVFSFPVTIFQEQAYVGGKGVSNRGGSVTDFLMQNPVSENVLLVEIKTPESKLLGSSYRETVYSINNDLTGAVIQVSIQRDSLLKEYTRLACEERDNNEREFQALHPHCLVIAGNLEKEIKSSPKKRKSFELFRSGLKDVQIITYDELFYKIETLLRLLENN
jgi:hypothetical protein